MPSLPVALPKSLRTNLLAIFAVVLLLLSFGPTARGQIISTTSSIRDGRTPSGLQPGSPVGSYPLSGFDNVNLYNGNLNFRIPLLQIGGRGSVQMTMTRAFNLKTWHIEHNHKVMPDENTIDTFTPKTSGLQPYSGYGAGRLAGRHYGLQMSSNLSCRWYSKTLSRITFSTSDGTEYELRDQLTNGQPLNSTCTQGAARGTVFVTADGSAATFISDTPIVDNPTVSSLGASGFSVSGLMMLRDGTRYRVDSGQITWMRDRNGNKISFTYTANSMTITDPLNRVVTINFNVSDVAPYGLCDQIIYKGFDGAQRIIRVSRTNLGNALRPGSGYTIKTLGTASGLFPETNGQSSTVYDPTVTSAIWLPDDRSYKFYYNSYGELARVELPTGGAYEYDMTPGSGVVCLNSCWPDDDRQIYRRLLERRVYPNGGTGSSYELKEVYTNTETTSSTTATVTVEKSGPTGTVLARSRHQFASSALNSLFGGAVAYAYGAWFEGNETLTESLSTAGPIGSATVLRRTAVTYAQRAPVSWWPAHASTVGLPIAKEPPNDPRVTQIVSTVEPSTANLVSKRTFGYDDTVPFNNRNNIKEFGYGVGSAGALVRETRNTFLTTSTYTGTNAHIRILPAQVSIYDGSGIERARATIEYDNYNSDSFHAGLLNRLNISGLDAAFTTSFTTRGNATASTTYLLVNGSVSGSMSSYSQYDIAGNTVKMIDPRSTTSNVIATSIEYDDRFGSPDNEARANTAPVELAGLSSFAFPSKLINPFGHTAYTQADYHLGRSVNREDPNGIVDSSSFNDLLDRPTQVRRAIGTSAENQVTISYDDTNRTVTTSSDRDANNDNLLVSKTLYDQLGRTIETRRYEGGTNYITTQTQYDPLGRAFKTSNPFRPWQGQTAVWTTQAFDALGRGTSVTTPDGAAVTTSYSGNSVTVTDQTGKARKSVTDALGHLIEVYEDPAGLNYQTTYNYDVLDNLVKVTQGTQQRFFMYDSLKRLIRARNPEQSTNASLNLSDPITGNSAWSSGYQYDANSNLTQKTDARGVVTVYGYDALNRNTTVDYSDTASINPDVKRFYDGATNGKGRFWHFYSGGDFSAGSNVDHTSIDSYDALGRPLVQRQLFKLNGVWGQTYQMSRGYNRGGAVTSQTYPSGRSVTYNYDSAGRLGDKDAQNLAFKGNLGDGVIRNYSTEILYSPLGGIAKEKFGTNTPLYNKSFYNNRGQLSEIRVGTTYTGPTDTGWERGAIINHYSSQCWGACSGTDNNGNLKQQDHWIPDSSGGVQAALVQNYTYDSLNRLLRVVEGSWQQEFVYDRWGNRTIHQTNTSGTGINKKPFNVDSNTNRLLVPAGQTGVMTYDAGGNLTNDTYSSYGSRTYDAENKMTSAQDSFAGSSFYTYNADGQRTRRKSNNQETWHVYGFDGDLLAEYAPNAAPSTPQKEYGYRNGQLLITANGAPLTNLALNKTATQSSTHSSGAVASRAVDGNTNGVFTNNSVTHTLSEANAWWQVDLGQVQSISTLKVWNRVEFPERLSNFYVFVSDVPFTSTNLTTTLNQSGVSSYHTSGQCGFPTELAINRTGRYIRVQLAGTNFLSIAEVQVLGVAAPSNVALNKTATQSSTHSSGAVASRAVDGNTNGVFTNNSVTHTLSEANAWWQVDLGQVETIGTIKVWNRVEFPERLSNFYVFVSDVPFTSTNLTTTLNQSGVSSYHTSGQCGFPTELAINRTGRYIRVQLAGTNFLSIAEVQVWTGSSTPSVQWLVSDHLGTPRMIIDQTGTLANIKRHDYLPFGEELFAGVGGRSTALGYSGGDNVRQQFTSKERDVETGLDYFEARYYSNLQGRFTSVDPGNAGAELYDPQSWHAYSYAGNAPLTFNDPSGLWKAVPCSSGKYMCWEAEKGDSIGNLAPLLNLNFDELNKFFQSPNVQEGQVFDVSGFFRNNTTTVYANIVQVLLVSEPPQSQTQIYVMATLPLIKSDPEPRSRLVGEALAVALYLYLEEQRKNEWASYVTPPQNLPAFPDAVRVRRKNNRVRWQDSDGNIYEWDYQHGRVEKYDKRGRHLGEFDPNTGEQTKPADPSRRTEP